MHNWGDTSLNAIGVFHYSTPVSGTNYANSGPHPKKHHLDEIELMSEEVWDDPDESGYEPEFPNGYWLRPYQTRSGISRSRSSFILKKYHHSYTLTKMAYIKSPRKIPLSISVSRPRRINIDISYI
jgi:hypothetical protein